MAKRVVDSMAINDSKISSALVRRHSRRRYDAAWRALETMEQRLLLSSSIAATTSTIQWGGVSMTVVPNQYVVATQNNVDFAQLAAAHGLQVTAESVLGSSGYYQITESQMAPADLAAWATSVPQITSLKPNQVYQQASVNYSLPLANMPSEYTADNAPPFKNYWDYVNQSPIATVPYPLNSSLAVPGTTLTSPPPPAPTSYIGFATGYVGADMGAAEAWNLTTGSQNVVVAVLDTGIDLPPGNTLTTDGGDITPNLWINPNLRYNAPDGGLTDGLVEGSVNGANFTDTDANGNITPDGNVQDTDGHGTFVATEIGATGNNTWTLNGTDLHNDAVGVNWHVTILPVKVVGANGATDAALIDAFNYIAQLKEIYHVNIVVANMSLGGFAAGSNLLNGTQQLKTAIQQATNAGIVITVAAGNDGQNVDTYPFFADNIDNPMVIKVAATTNRDTLAGFSNYGANSVQLGAPGEDILSYNLTTESLLLPSGSPNFDSGTSMAAPLVAGTIALEAAANPNASPTQLVNACLNNTDPIAALTGKTTTGGRLNAFKAVEAIIGVQPPGGAVDTFSASQISGWAYSPNQGAAPTTVNIVIDGVTTPIIANQPRLDLQTLLGTPNHAFTYSPSLSPGIHNVSIYAVDVNGVKNILIFSGILNGTTPPFGSVDFVNDQTAFGWAFDHVDNTNPTYVRVDIDGVKGTQFLANVARPDLTAWLGSSDHGFVFTMPANLTFGFHRVDIYAIYTPTGQAYLLGSATVIHDKPVLGNLDTIDTAQIVGWAADPDDMGQAVTMRVTIDGNAGALFSANIQMTAVEIATAPADLYLQLGSEGHRFDYTLPALLPGVHTVDIYTTDIDTGDSQLFATRQINGILPPGGVVDGLTAQQVFGWAYSPQAGATPINVRVDIDGNTGQTILASIPRPDIQSLLGSDNHGFSYNLPVLSNGTHTISVYAIDPDTYVPTLINSLSLTVPPAANGNLLPFGNVDIFNPASIVGWAYDPNAAASPIAVRIDVDGATAATGLANQARPDLAAGNLTIGTRHGFDIDLPVLTPGAHRIDVYGIDSTSGQAVLLKTGYVNPTPTVGRIEGLTPAAITGWAYDPLTGNNTLFRLDIDGVPGNVQTTNLNRSDLGYAVATLGFSVATPPLTPGTHRVELFIIEGNSEQPVLAGGGDIVANVPPGGIVDVLNSHTISGWAFSPEIGANPVNVVIRIDGVSGAELVANQSRLDLVGLLGSANHGFQFTFSNNVSGQHTIEVDVVDPITGQIDVLEALPIIFN